VEGADAVMRAGSGPRHIALHPTKPLVFVANELDSTVATLRFDPARGVLSVIDVAPTLPSPGATTNYPADIHVGPDGRSLYVSNRGHNSITVFAIQDSGTLTNEQVIPTRGDWPRNFALDNTGRWVLVANQRSNSIVVFRRDQKTGWLQPTSHRIELPSPVCVKFFSPG
jgi:6-phosphogluconolactonase